MGEITNSGPPQTGRAALIWSHTQVATRGLFAKEVDGPETVRGSESHWLLHFHSFLLSYRAARKQPDGSPTGNPLPEMGRAKRLPPVLAAEIRKATLLRQGGFFEQRRERHERRMRTQKPA